MRRARLRVPLRVSITIEIMEAINVIEFPITLPNQERVDKLTKMLTICGAIVSLGAGIITNNLLVLCIAFAVLFLITVIAVAPSWPMYKGKNLKWLEVKY